jgi:hypothetical protein
VKYLRKKSVVLDPLLDLIEFDMLAYKPQLRRSARDVRLKLLKLTRGWDFFSKDGCCAGHNGRSIETGSSPKSLDPMSDCCPTVNSDKMEVDLGEVKGSLATGLFSSLSYICEFREYRMLLSSRTIHQVPKYQKSAHGSPLQDRYEELDSCHRPVRHTCLLLSQRQSFVISSRIGTSSCTPDLIAGDIEGRIDQTKEEKKDAKKEEKKVKGNSEEKK